MKIKMSYLFAKFCSKTVDRL